MFYLMLVIGMLCVGVIGYMIGWERGCRKTHEKIQRTQRKPRKQQSYTSATKQLRLVRTEDTRE